MPWFPVDDAFHSHPKARKAGDEALGMWCRAGSHCMAYLTDGFVAEWWVQEQPKGVAKAKRLVAANLWRVGVNAEGEAGWWFHDWKPECMKSHVLAVREKARQRKARSRESHGESRVTDVVTDSVSPAERLVPTQPNPTQPNNPLVDLSGEVTKGDAPKPPSEFCSKHPNDTDKGCFACGQARRTYPERKAKWDSERREAAARERQAAINACGLCDEYGQRSFPDGSARRCKHHEEAVNG